MRVARYKVVVDRFAAEIRSGRLAPGAKLPTHRELAASEGIALVTATRVYAELEAMGLVSGEQGRGTFVRETALTPGHGVDQQAVAADAVDLNFNYPAVPGQADLLRRALRDLATGGDLDALLRYQPHGGRPQDRAAMARHARRLALPADPARTLIVNGAQHGLAVTVMAMLKPGDVVAVDALSYPGFKIVADTYGLEVAAIPVTDSGPDLEALSRLCAARRVRAVYAMPTMHNPLGWVLDRPAREKLVALARRNGLYIIEDGSYAYLAADAPPPLAALAPEITFHVSGLSKSVATGLRVGFVVAPAGSLSLLERCIRATTWNVPALTATIACTWIDDGTVERLENEKRADAQARQSVAREVFDGMPYRGHSSSYFLWLPLPDDARADRVAADLAARRISVSTAEPYATTGRVPQALRLALGSAPMDGLRKTLFTVREVVEDHAFR